MTTEPINERYLWDRSGPPDPETRRLEAVLGALRHRRRAAPPARRPTGLLRLAAALALAAAGAWLLVARGGPAPGGFEVRPLAGTATIDADPLASPRRLGVGSWLETGPGSRALVRVAGLGRVEVGPRSRIGLLESRAAGVHRLRLDRGRIDALITAPPRLFVVDTASAAAVDLGCAYTLEVDEAGDGLLEVTLGLVALEDGDQSATVPRGARCRLRAGAGPGVPWFTDAGAALREAVERFETGADRAGAVTAILAAARPRDTLTLWHLLPRVAGDARARVAQRIVELAGPPRGVDLPGALRLDAEALRDWWYLLELDW